MPSGEAGSGDSGAVVVVEVDVAASSAVVDVAVEHAAASKANSVRKLTRVLRRRTHRSYWIEHGMYQRHRQLGFLDENEVRGCEFGELLLVGAAML